MTSTQISVAATPGGWELAAETFAVKIRWFGLLVGCVLVNVPNHPIDRLAVFRVRLPLAPAAERDGESW